MLVKRTRRYRSHAAPYPCVALCMRFPPVRTLTVCLTAHTHRLLLSPPWHRAKSPYRPGSHAPVWVCMC